MPRILLVFTLLLFCAGITLAAPAKPPLVLRTDTTQVKVRTYNPQVMNNYRKQPAFQYKHTYFAPSLWGRFWKWFWSLFDWDVIPADKRGAFWEIVRYVFIGLGVAALLFIIFRMLGVDIRSVFGRKSTSTAIPYSESLENIHEINFDTELENAIARHDYRLAVRLLYLRCLKQLNDDGAIHWEISKTNSTYINEIVNHDKRQNFALLTRQFEYVWYGEFRVDGPAFSHISTLFNDFRKQRPSS